MGVCDVVAVSYLEEKQRDSCHGEQDRQSEPEHHRHVDDIEHLGVLVVDVKGVFEVGFYVLENVLGLSLIAVYLLHK